MRVVERVQFVQVQGQLRANVQALPEAETAVAGDPAELAAALDRSAFAGWAREPAALEQLARRLGEDRGSLELAVGSRQDAGLSVEVAPDASRAWLDIQAARGGHALQANDALTALGAAGVVAGIDADAVARACAAGADIRVEAAKAVPPVHGEPARFEMLVDDSRNRAPKVNEYGLVDFHELGDIPIVHAGQALMRRFPPTRGVDGRNVRGERLPAIAGRDEGFDLKLAGASVDPADANLLCAACSGQPVHTSNGVAVEQVLRLKNVNLASGNIRFDGTVEVAGDVSPGMVVQATGDIVIGGLVEGAHIEANGCVKIGGGVIAHADVRAGGTVAARFAENATIRAGTVLVIEKTALHCDLQALNQVSVGAAAGSRGKLVGGTTRAMLRVSTPQLGAPAGGVTTVQIGVNPELAERQFELRRRIAAQKDEEEKLEKVLAHLKQHGDPRGMRARVEVAWKQSIDAWGALLAEQEVVNKQLALAEAARIEIAAGVSGDVDIAFGEQMRHLRGAYGAGTFHLDAGQLVFTDSSGQAKPVT